MAFLEERLPITITAGSRGGPVASRTKVYSTSGKLQQDFRWSRPLQRYDLSYGIKTLANFEAVRAMWYVVMFTPCEGFRIRDWSDYQATQTNTGAVLIGGTTWQLQRIYTVGASSFRRPIYKLDGAPLVYRTRSGATTLITPSTLAANAGTVTLTGHTAGDTYTWAGQFDVPVTFTDDAMDQIEITGNAQELLQALPSIKIEELRLS